MRIRESAYFALTCLFFTVNNSLAQFSADELPDGRKRQIEISPVSNHAAPGWNIGFLSQPKYTLQTVQVASKAIFASQTQCEIYDFKTALWATHQFSVTRRDMSVASAGRMAFFAGGSKGPHSQPGYLNRVDIYNALSDRWSATKLSEPRKVGVSGAAGNKAVFAGGKTTSGFSDRADIFDAVRGGRASHKLSQARDNMAAGSAGTKFIIAGGQTGNIHSPVSSDAVDIYEVHSDSWSAAKLSRKRHNISVATAGNKVIFAGGITATAGRETIAGTVDIYDAVKNSWQVTTLSEARYGMTVVVIDDKVYFAGGIVNSKGTLSSKVEVYNVATNTWSVTSLPAARAGMAVGITGNRLMLAGGSAGNINNPTDRVEVLDLQTGQWSTEYLSVPRTAVAAASYNNKVIFAGGTITAAKYPYQTEASAVVDTWTDPATVVLNTVYTMESADFIPVKTRQLYEWIYPDPANDSFITANLWKYETKTVKISVLDENRVPVITKAVIPFGKTMEQVNIAMLPKGSYWVLIESEGYKPVLKAVSIKGTAPRQLQQETILALADTHQ